MTVKTVVHRVHASSGPHRQLLVVLLFVGILLMKLDFVAGDINCQCDVDGSNCSDSAQSCKIKHYDVQVTVYTAMVCTELLINTSASFPVPP